VFCFTATFSKVAQNFAPLQLFEKVAQNFAPLQLFAPLFLKVD